MTASRTSARSWPFWLLLAAWLCANSPQAATIAVLEWLDGARQFQHQQRLTLQVASLLAGESAPAEQDLRTSANQPGPTPPALPPEFSLKRIDLAMEKATDEVVLPTGGVSPVAETESMPEPRGVRPLYEPPRFGNIS